MEHLINSPMYQTGPAQDGRGAQASPISESLQVPGQDPLNTMRRTRLEQALTDPSIQQASKRLRKTFLAYAAAVSLDAKHPTAKTRAFEESAETLLQETIELELLGLKLAAYDSCAGPELPDELLLLNNDALTN